VQGKNVLVRSLLMAKEANIVARNAPREEHAAPPAIHSQLRILSPWQHRKPANISLAHGAIVAVRPKAGLLGMVRPASSAAVLAVEEHRAQSCGTQCHRQRQLPSFKSVTPAMSVLSRVVPSRLGMENQESIVAESTKILTNPPTQEMSQLKLYKFLLEHFQTSLPSGRRR